MLTKLLTRWIHPSPFFFHAQRDMTSIDPKVVNQARSVTIVEAKKPEGFKVVFGGFNYIFADKSTADDWMKRLEDHLKLDIYDVDCTNDPARVIRHVDYHHPGAMVSNGTRHADDITKIYQILRNLPAKEDENKENQPPQVFSTPQFAPPPYFYPYPPPYASPYGPQFYPPYTSQAAAPGGSSSSLHPAASGIQRPTIVSKGFATGGSTTKEGRGRY